MADNYQHGTRRGRLLRANDSETEELLAEGAPGSRTSDIEKGIANDSGTIHGRKVNHADPHDIPPRGMKRRY